MKNNTSTPLQERVRGGVLLDNMISILFYSFICYNFFIKVQKFVCGGILWETKIIVYSSLSESFLGGVSITKAPEETTTVEDDNRNNDNNRFDDSRSET